MYLVSHRNNTRVVQRWDLPILRWSQTLQHALSCMQVELVGSGRDTLIDEGTQELVAVVVVNADAPATSSP